MQYQKIELQEIVGIHDAIKKTEFELDLEPVHLPGKELILPSLISILNQRIPISVMRVGEEYLCTFQFGLYRWMKGHLSGDTGVWCLVEESRVNMQLGEQLFFGERCFCPSLYKSTSLAAASIFDYLKKSPAAWPNAYKNRTDLSRILGVKPLKVKQGV